MKQYLQTCPIKEVFDTINHRNNKQIGISAYETPKIFGNNFQLYQQRQNNKSDKGKARQFQKQNTKPKKQELLIYKGKEVLTIPSNKSFLKYSQKLQTQKLHLKGGGQFSKLKKESTYIPKQKLQNKEIGPGRYNVIMAFDYLQNKNQQKKLPQINKSNYQRRVFSEEIAARSLQNPGVGYYNVNNSTAFKNNSLYTRSGSKKLSQHQWVNLHNKKQLKLKNKDLTPCSNAYNPFPRSFSLFSTLKKQQKSKLTFFQFNRRENQKKANQKLKVKNKNAIGPGKYLSLNDWNQNINDKKGINFISRIKTQSVYQ